MLNIEENQYICKYCGKSFKAKNGLSLHIRCIHLKDLKPVICYKQCPYCNNLIRTSGFIRHIEICKDFYKPYYCQKCGKLVTKKFGSGKFCSRKCANSHHLSEVSKQKISSSVKNADKTNYYNSIEQHKKFRKNSYYNSPTKCIICNSILPYNKRYKKTCSELCRRELIRRSALKQELHGCGKQGRYKNFWCNSTFELVFIIYCLDHNINIERNRKAYKYIYNNKSHKYIPDFLINNELIEIKGYYTDLVDVKLKSVNDRPIKVLFKKDIQHCFDYVDQKYYNIIGNKKDYTRLYNMED